MSIWHKLSPFYKPSTGIGRGRGRRKGAAAKTEPKVSKYAGAPEILETQIDASRPEALKELAEMAKRGEIPSDITGSKEDRARLFEEIDRLYDVPPGELGKYTTVPESSRSLDLRFEHEFLSGGVQPRVRTANYLEKASPAEISGATKYAIYKQRPVLEQALMYRADGWPTLEMSLKYGVKGTRTFTDTEKTQIDKEIRAYIEGQFKSPLSRKGEQFAAAYWKKQGNRWIRTG